MDTAVVTDVAADTDCPLPNEVLVMICEAIMPTKIIATRSISLQLVTINNFDAVDCACSMMLVDRTMFEIMRPIFMRQFGTLKVDRMRQLIADKDGFTARLAEILHQYPHVFAPVCEIDFNNFSRQKDFTIQVQSNWTDKELLQNPYANYNTFRINAVTVNSIGTYVYSNYGRLGSNTKKRCQDHWSTIFGITFANDAAEALRTIDYLTSKQRKSVKNKIIDLIPTYIIEGIMCTDW